MESGDGLLMRAKIVGSKLSLTRVSEIAAIALDCGNGRIDLSQRAQLQIRGVTETTLAAAQARSNAGCNIRQFDSGLRLQTGSETQRQH